MSTQSTRGEIGTSPVGKDSKGEGMVSRTKATRGEMRRDQPTKMAVVEVPEEPQREAEGVTSQTHGLPKIGIAEG